MVQTIGIPMGADPEPFMANAHLHKYEFDFQERQTKINYKLARSLNYTFRYIDDVSIINDNGNFIKHIGEIYPSELVLSKENCGTSNATVLDLNIRIIDSEFRIGVLTKLTNLTLRLLNIPLYKVIYRIICCTMYFNLKQSDSLTFVTKKNLF